jgi:hypothetical protein
LNPGRRGGNTDGFHCVILDVAARIRRKFYQYIVVESHYVTNRYRPLFLFH